MCDTRASHLQEYLEPYNWRISGSMQRTRNVHDRCAVCLRKSGAIVGHVPHEISRVLGTFIRHGGNVSCRVSGRRKLGHGLEVPCTYVLAGK